MLLPQSMLVSALVAVAATGVFAADTATPPARQPAQVAKPAPRAHAIHLTTHAAVAAKAAAPQHAAGKRPAPAPATAAATGPSESLEDGASCACYSR